MIYVIMVLATAAFIWTFRKMKVLTAVREALADSHAGFTALTDTLLGDAQKEKLAQQASLRMFRHAVVLVLRMGVALLAPTAIIAVALYSGGVSRQALLSLLHSWIFFLFSALVFALELIWRSRAR